MVGVVMLRKWEPHPEGVPGGQPAGVKHPTLFHAWRASPQGPKRIHSHPLKNPCSGNPYQKESFNTQWRIIIEENWQSGVPEGREKGKGWCHLAFVSPAPLRGVGVQQVAPFQDWGTEVN